MKIAGFKKQSFIDYPGNVSSVVFTQGCNFRCSYCHNPELVDPARYTQTYSEANIMEYIENYKHLLDAVCITGGEPTLHADLPNFIEKIKTLGLKVKLDTNGTNPDLLNELIRQKMLDCIAMDIKHILEFPDYKKVVGERFTIHQLEQVIRSVVLIKISGVAYQFRTTVAKGLHQPAHIKQLRNQFRENYVIQNLNPEIMLCENKSMQTFSEVEFHKL